MSPTRFLSTIIFFVYACVTVAPTNEFGNEYHPHSSQYRDYLMKHQQLNDSEENVRYHNNDKMEQSEDSDQNLIELIFPLSMHELFDELECHDAHETNDDKNSEFQSSDEKSHYQKVCPATIMNPLILGVIFSNLRWQDLKNAARVCQTWQIVASSFYNRLNRITNILFVKCPPYDVRTFYNPTLKFYKERVDCNKDKEKYQWRPELTMIFRKTFTSSGNSADDPLRVHMAPIIRNSRTFVISPCYPVVNNFEQNDAAIFIGYDSFGLIFPEALLAQTDIGVGIISLPLELFGDNSALFNDNDKAEGSRKSFEQFGWRNEHPIKFAIVMSRRIPDDSTGTNDAYQRAKKVTRWLKSLPEGGNMPVCITLDESDSELQSNTARMNGPVSVILFGGGAVHVTAYFHTNKFYRPRAIRWLFTQFKKNVNKKMPAASQRIAFHIGKNDYRTNLKHFSYPFHDTLCVELNGHSEVFGLDTMETDIAVLDRSRQISQQCFAVIGFD